MKHREVFERLDPPPGGLARLRDRLEDRPRARWARLVWAPAVALGVAVVFVRVGGGKVDVLAAARGQGGASEVGLGLSAPPEAVVTLTDESRSTTALARVPTSDPRVAMFRFATLR